MIPHTSRVQGADLKQTESRIAKLEAWAWGMRCSFCGKGQAEVSKLIAGPSSRICDECVILCLDILFGAALQREPASGAGSVSKPGFEPGHDPP